MRLILTRHGETEENKKDIIQGHLPGKLTPLGREQIKKLALRLKDEKIDAIYSSDLARASETAKEIAKFHPDVPLHFVKELREKSFGKYEGKTAAEVGIGPGESHITFERPGVESVKEMKARASQFLDKILHKHRNETVLFVAHGGINNAIIRVITGLPISELRGTQPHTGVSIFEINGDKSHRIILRSSTDHLK